MANYANKRKPFNGHNLLLCEGIEDEAFLRALIADRNLGAFDVRPVINLCGIGGKDAFFKALVNAATITGFKNIKKIGIIADADDHYNDSFKMICRQINNSNTDPNVNGRFQVPTDSYLLSGGYPRIMIILFPARKRRGALETLLWDAIRNTQMYAANLNCVGRAVDCANIQGWPRAKLDKSRVRMSLALSFKKSPTVNISRIWAQYPEAIPIDSEEFDEIANVISSINA